MILEAVLVNMIKKIMKNLKKMRNKVNNRIMLPFLILAKVGENKMMTRYKKFKIISKITKTSKIYYKYILNILWKLIKKNLTYFFFS